LEGISGNTNNLLKDKANLSCIKNVMSVEMPCCYFFLSLQTGMAQIDIKYLQHNAVFPTVTSTQTYLYTCLQLVS